MWIKCLLTRYKSGRYFLSWVRKLVNKLKRFSKFWLPNMLGAIRKSYYYKTRYGDTNSPINIVFLVHLPTSWSALESVYTSCANDCLFNPVIVTIPRKQPNTDEEWLYNNENYEFIKAKGFDVLRGYNEKNDTWLDLKSLKPDVVFVQTPYENQRYYKYSSSYINRYSRIAYLQYAFIVTAGEFEPHFYNMQFHRNCWRLFAESNYHLELYKKYAPDVLDQVIVTGYPKFDAYLEKLEDLNYPWLIKREDRPDVKRIIWSPHWTINDKYLQASNFLKYYDYILSLAAENRNVEVIIRPHPFLFSELIQGKHWTQEKLDEYMEEIESLDNISIDKKPDYFQLFRTSDILIADNGSFLGEYLPTKKPIIYTHSYKTDSHNLSDYGKKLTQYHYIAHNVDELELLIERVLVNGDDFNRNLRLANTEKYLYIAEFGSGVAIKDHIKKEFGF